MTTIRLKSFHVLPRDDGWSSPEYKFGRITTLVTGENGAGKTPMLRALALTLGAKVELPQEMVEKCHGVRLVLVNGSRTITIERAFAQVYAMFKEDGRSTPCSGEEEISRELMRHLSIDPRALVRRKDDQPVSPYMSVLAPLFFVDQDHGWKDVYEPPPNLNFLHEQREEALRWILDIPQRTIEKSRREKDEAKRKETALLEQVEVKKRYVASLRRQVGDDGRNGGREELEVQRANIAERLNALVQSFDGLSRVDAALEAETRQAVLERDASRDRFQSLERQLLNLRQTHRELENDASVLEANEIAANVFRGFCGNEDCNLFRPQDSYGRRLLHLRDQVKDVDSTTNLLVQQVEQARETLAQCQARLDQQLQRRRVQTSNAGGDALVAVIDSLTKESAQISVRLDRLQTLEDERRRLSALVEQAQRATDEVAQLAGTRSAPGGARLADARTLLARAMDKWLIALKTRHVSGSAVFDANLTPFINGSRFSVASSQSGSTRTRYVLALHAAVIEASIEMKGFHPPFLILDAPKQQELHSPDLAAFVSACATLFEKQEPAFQLIVGAKDRDIFEAPPNVAWEPKFKSADGYHFLG